MNITATNSNATLWDLLLTAGQNQVNSLRLEDFEGENLYKVKLKVTTSGQGIHIDNGGVATNTDMLISDTSPLFEFETLSLKSINILGTAVSVNVVIFIS